MGLVTFREVVVGPDSCEAFHRVFITFTRGAHNLESSIAMHMYMYIIYTWPASYVIIGLAFPTRALAPAPHAMYMSICISTRPLPAQLTGISILQSGSGVWNSICTLCTCIYTYSHVVVFQFYIPPSSYHFKLNRPRSPTSD